MHGPKWSNFALNKADVVVAVGARFDDRVTGKLSAFAPGATIVHLDIDAAEISKIRHADIPVVGPLKPVLAALAKALATDAVPGRTDGVAPPDRRVARAVPAWRTALEPAPMLKPQKVLEQLQELTAGRDDVVWTTGVGQHQMWAMQYVLCDTRARSSPRAGSGRWGTASRRRSARRPRDPTRR